MGHALTVQAFGGDWAKPVEAIDVACRAPEVNKTRQRIREEIRRGPSLHRWLNS
jgi:regulator of RNase E activity RraA